MPLLSAMTQAIPKIQMHMTASPYSIGRDQPLSRAHALMREHQIRHLPVLEGGELVGVVTDRDLRLIESLRDVDAAQVSVQEAMASEVYAVKPDALLDEVVETMAKYKYGCAVVIHNYQVVGIFTTVDACRVLAELLRGRLTH
jgi:acetoin utilization protein AcuB